MDVQVCLPSPPPATGTWRQGPQGRAGVHHTPPMNTWRPGPADVQVRPATSGVHLTDELLQVPQGALPGGGPAQTGWPQPGALH